MRMMSGGPCSHYDCSNRNVFGYCNTTVCINVEKADFVEEEA